MNRIKIKALIIAIIAIVVVALSYLLLWGKLFPYSPIKIGFSKHELSNVIVYVQHGTEYKNYKIFDTYLPAVENFHELRFKKKPKIFIFRDRDSYLQRSTTKARFCAYPNSSLVTSPWALKEAEEGKISLEIYLKHELSHTLLYQHMGIKAAYIYYPRWLLEGIAMYSANQMGTSWYPGKAETYEYIRQGNFMPPHYYNTSKEDQVSLKVENRIAFIYSEFGFIVDYIIITYGKDNFLKYMKRLFTESDHNRVFKDIFGIDFESFVLNFKKSVQTAEIM